MRALPGVGWILGCALLHARQHGHQKVGAHFPLACTPPFWETDFHFIFDPHRPTCIPWKCLKDTVCNTNAQVLGGNMPCAREDSRKGAEGKVELDVKKTGHREEGLLESFNEQG